MGYGTAVVLGHKEYYPRFGYRKAIDLGIEFPFEVSHEYCMVAELIPGATENVKGMVCYPTDFNSLTSKIHYITRTGYFNFPVRILIVLIQLEDCVASRMKVYPNTLFERRFCYLLHEKIRIHEVQESLSIP